MAAQNPWWSDPGSRAAASFDLRRSEFDSLKDRILLLGGPQVLLVGPRQAGKTVLLWQLADWLLGERRIVRDPRQVVLVDFEDARLPHPRPTLREVVEAHGRMFPDLNEPTFFLFDEVARSRDWDSNLKQLHGEQLARGPSPRRFIVTDSASVLLDGRSRVAGRFDRFHLPFLSFPDFARLRQGARFGNSQWPAMAGPEFDAYLERGGCPAYLMLQDPSLVRRSLREATERSVILDLGAAGLRKQDEAIRLFAALAADSGSILKATERGADVGVPRQTVDRWVRTLAGCGLLVRLEPSTRSARAGSRLQPRLYCADPGMAAAFALAAQPLEDGAARGRIVETAALVHFDGFARRTHARLGYGTGEAECDVVVDLGVMRLAVQVTSGRDASRADAMRAARAAAALENGVGLVTSRHPARLHHDVHDARVTEVPIWSLCEALGTVSDAKEFLRWLK